jgi:hypothetical protein
VLGELEYKIEKLFYCRRREERKKKAETKKEEREEKKVIVLSCVTIYPSIKTF